MPVSAVTLVFVIVAAVAVFVIAALVVGREAHRLDAVAPRSVYIPEEAGEFVAKKQRQPGTIDLRLCVV